MSKKFLFLLALVMGEAVCMETITEVVDDGFGVNFTKFDVSKDQKYEIKFKYNNELLYQPVETKNGILFFGEHALNSERKPIEGRYNPNRAKLKMLQDGFPQYPIISGKKVDGHFSLKNLSTILEEDILGCAVTEQLNCLISETNKSNNPQSMPNILIQLLDQKSSQEKSLIAEQYKKHTTAAQRLPDGLQKLAQLNMLGNTQSWKVRAQFNQEKEELYLSLSILNRLREIDNEETFLEKIYDIDAELNTAFNSDQNNGGNIQNTDKLKEIEKRLNHNAPTVRHATVKALLLSALCHVDKYPGLTKDGEVIEAVCINYGQMARFVRHIKDRRHAYSENDIIPEYTDSSYWILKEGFSPADLYKALYDTAITTSCQINNVWINEIKQNGVLVPSMKKGIVIDLDAPVLVKKVQNMIHAYWDGCTRAANFIRVVIKEDNGFFKLATAHPVYSKKECLKSDEKPKSVFAILNNYLIYKPMDDKMTFLPSHSTPTTDKF